ncbi:MAG: GtrA family protein [Elusimicrobia bacterium]|nr:GtrA family protein [Elusimicrobiota bacterium]
MHPAVQFIKYSIGGAIATAVDVAIFYTAAILILPALGSTDPVVRLLGLAAAPLAESVRSTRYVADKVIAFLFSNLAAYIVNVLWVFTPGRHSKAMEFTLFFLVSIVSFTAGTALGWLLIKSTGLPTTYAYAANAVASVSINYVCRKYIVFKG